MRLTRQHTRNNPENNGHDLYLTCWTENSTMIVPWFLTHIWPQTPLELCYIVWGMDVTLPAAALPPLLTWQDYLEKRTKNSMEKLSYPIPSCKASVTTRPNPILTRSKAAKLRSRLGSILSSIEAMPEYI